VKLFKATSDGIEAVGSNIVPKITSSTGGSAPVKDTSSSKKLNRSDFYNHATFQAAHLVHEHRAKEASKIGDQAGAERHSSRSKEYHSKLDPRISSGVKSGHPKVIGKLKAAHEQLAKQYDRMPPNKYSLGPLLSGAHKKLSGSFGSNKPPPMHLGKSGSDLVVKPKMDPNSNTLHSHAFDVKEMGKGSGFSVHGFRALHYPKTASDVRAAMSHFSLHKDTHTAKEEAAIKERIRRAAKKHGITEEVARTPDAAKKDLERKAKRARKSLEAVGTLEKASTQKIEQERERVMGPAGRYPGFKFAEGNQQMMDKFDEAIDTSKSLESINDLQKCFGDRVTRWADEFMWTPFYVEALELVKREVLADEDSHKFQETKKPWRERDDLPRSERDKLDKEYSQKEKMFDKKREEISAEKKKLEAKLLDHKIKNAKNGSGILKAMTAASMPRVPRAMRVDTWRSATSVMTRTNSALAKDMHTGPLTGELIEELKDEEDKRTRQIYKACPGCGRRYMAKSLDDPCPSCSIHKSGHCGKCGQQLVKSLGSTSCPLCG
jgi:hypothetical protein